MRHVAGLLGVFTLAMFSVLVSTQMRLTRSEEMNDFYADALQRQSAAMTEVFRADERLKAEDAKLKAADDRLQAAATRLQHECDDMHAAAISLIAADAKLKRVELCICR